MARILLDSDVFIDHLRGRQRLHVADDDPHYSTVTRAELFAGRSSDEDRVQRLLAPFVELAVDRPVAERAGHLRRQGALLLPDALIAATALEHGLILVTRNRRHFSSVADLRIRDPR